MDGTDLQHRMDLGERIVKAARLAAAMHMYAAVREQLHACDGQDDQTTQTDDLRQRVRIGGAGPVAWSSRATHVTDDGRPA